MADLLLGICAATLEQADAMLEAEHKWLCDNLDLIEELVAKAAEMKKPAKHANRQAQLVRKHLAEYLREAGWFQHGGRGLTFRDICAGIGAEYDIALSRRAPLLKLPFNPAAVMRALRMLGARKERRGRAAA